MLQYCRAETQKRTFKGNGDDYSGKKTQQTSTLIKRLLV